jgi:SAM-dependent methyltransferase
MSNQSANPAIFICLIAAASANSASSRLRCFGLARELRKLGYSATVSNSPDPKSNVLLIQKIVNPNILVQAQSFKERGGLVVYDIDDHGDVALGSLKADSATFSAFLECVSIVVVDTETRKDTLSQDQRYKNIRHFWVVPDPIDYIEDINELSFSEKAVKKNKYKGCWFGNAPNIVPALPHLLSVCNSAHVASMDVITNQEYIGDIQQKFPGLITSAWKLETFPSILSSMDFCILIHDSSVEGLQKSNNKMLAALAMGVVPFVSRTPAYEATAIEFGLPELIIDSPEDILDRLLPDKFQYLQRKLHSPDHIDLLKNFSPANSAEIFINSLVEYMQLENKSSLTYEPVKLNLGSGSSPLPGYINVDVAPERLGVMPDIVCDIRSLMVFTDNYADEIIAVHVIEHFWRWEVVQILKEWARVLKPGGKLILECPNLITACEELLKNPIVAAGPGPEGQRSMWCLYGDPDHKDPLMCHRWLYTPESLAQVLFEVGLIDLKREPAQFKLRDPRDMRITGIKPSL